MKKNYFLALFISISSLLITSCDKNDDETPIAQKDYLIAKWDLKKVDIKISVDGEVVQEMEDYDTTAEMTMQFDFKEDKSVSLYQYYPATEDSEAEEFTYTGTYTRNGNILDITIDGDKVNFEISLNDENNLHLANELEETYEGMVIKQNMTYKFTKM